MDEGCGEARMLFCWRGCRISNQVLLESGAVMRCVRGARVSYCTSAHMAWRLCGSRRVHCGQGVASVILFVLVR